MIFNITTITTSADTAVVSTLDMRNFYAALNGTSTLTCTYASGNVVVGKTVVFTCTGATSAETQDNVNKLQTWWSNLMSHAHLGTIHSKPYVMNQATITADAGLIHSTAGTEPLTTTVVAV